MDIDFSDSNVGLTRHLHPYYHINEEKADEYPNVITKYKQLLRLKITCTRPLSFSKYIIILKNCIPLLVGAVFPL